MFIDWFDFYWEQLSNPLSLAPGVYNLPLLFIALQPLRLLGPLGSAILVQLLSLIILVLVCHREHLPLRRFALIVVSPVTFTHVLFGQIDGLLLIALLAPVALSTFCSLCKPQTLAPVWLGELRKQPLLVLFISLFLVNLALALWGWPVSLSPLPAPPPQWNYSAWPTSLLLIPLIFHRDKRFSWLIAPFAFPYVGLASLWLPLLAAAQLRPVWPLLLLWTTLAARLVLMLS